jgi:hypothetical protein
LERDPDRDEDDAGDQQRLRAEHQDPDAPEHVRRRGDHEAERAAKRR